MGEMRKNNSEMNCSLHVSCGTGALDKATFSGQDASQTPTQLLLQSSSMSLQLSYLAN